MQPDEPRVVQVGERLHLAALLEQVVRAGSGPEALHRYLGAKPQVTGPVDLCGGSRSDHRAELVPAGEETRIVSPCGTLVGSHMGIVPPTGAKDARIRENVTRSGVSLLRRSSARGG
ncbi:hypothetical protein GCM10009609_58520 [Pseudonocardia aurantiaca]